MFRLWFKKNVVAKCWYWKYQFGIYLLEMYFTRKLPQSHVLSLKCHYLFIYFNYWFILVTYWERNFINLSNYISNNQRNKLPFYISHLQTWSCINETQRKKPVIFTIDIRLIYNEKKLCYYCYNYKNIWNEMYKKMTFSIHV